MYQTSEVIKQVYEYLYNRRAAPRFRIKPGAYAVTAGKYSMLGPVTNISMGGLGFIYINQENQPDSTELCLTVPEADFFIDNISYKTVYNFEIVNEFHADFSVIRRCGVAFTCLSQDQIDLLDDFISQYTHSDL